MKTLLLAFFSIVFSVSAFAQNEPELIQEYDSQSPVHFILIDTDMPKILVRDGSQFEIYNLDFTLYTTFSYPLGYESFNSFNHPVLLTRSLFDCDSTQLEFMMIGTNDNGVNQIKIFHEDGTEFFSLDNYQLVLYGIGNLNDRNLVSTSDGTYISFSVGIGSTTKRIYKFCGQLPQTLPRNAEGEIITGLVGFESGTSGFKISPNPSRDQIKLEYDLEENKEGTVTLFSQTGQIVKEVRLGPAFDFIYLNISDLEQGTYIARILSADGFQLSEKFVKVK